jgi:hypothetical protein
MFEVVACICGVLLVGGIAKICSGERHTEEYYTYLRNNKKTPDGHKSAQDNYYRYL